MTMQLPTPAETLKARILVLEERKTQEGILLKEQLLEAYESLKPATLIKNTLSELTNAPGLKGNLLDTAISLAAGHLSKKVVIGSTQNPFKELLGNFLQMAVTSIVSKNTGDIRSGISRLVDLILQKTGNPDK